MQIRQLTWVGLGYQFLDVLVSLQVVILLSLDLFLSVLKLSDDIVELADECFFSLDALGAEDLNLLVGVVDVLQVLPLVCLEGRVQFGGLQKLQGIRHTFDDLFVLLCEGLYLLGELDLTALGDSGLRNYYSYVATTCRIRVSTALTW